MDWRGWTRLSSGLCAIAIIVALWHVIDNTVPLNITRSTHTFPAETDDSAYGLQRNVSAHGEDFISSGATDSKLEKRKMAAVVDDQTFERYRCKGERLVHWMSLSRYELDRNVEVPPLVYYNHDNMYAKDNGWEGQNHDVNTATLEQGILDLTGIAGVEGVSDNTPLSFQQPATAEPSTRWRTHRSVQSKEYVRRDLGQSVPWPSTGGVYDMMVNVRQSALIITNAYSPAHQSSLMGWKLERSQLPLVQRLSDVAYLHWIAERLPEVIYSQGNKDPPPAWILIKDAWGPDDTLGVVSTCLRKYGWAVGGLPGWENRITFPIGSYCHAAILGTPNSAGLAFFLLSHRHVQRLSTLSAVTVYGTGKTNGNGDEVPSFLWSTSLSGVYGLPVVRFLAENRAYQAAHPNDDDITQFPHRLRPLPIDPNGDTLWAGGFS